MSRINLTPTRIKNATLPSGKTLSFLWDEKVRGFGVRITQSAKSYIARGRIKGGSNSDIRVKISDCDSITLEDARKSAQTILSQFSAGIDPREETKRSARKEAIKRQESLRQDVTVKSAWDEYTKERAAHWSDKYKLDHQRFIAAGGEKRKRSKQKTIAGVLYPLTNLKLSEIKPPVVKKWLANESNNRATQARIGFEMFRTFLNWCEEDERYKGLADINSCSAKIKKDNLPQKSSRDDCLQKEMLEPWFKAVSTYKNRIMSAYFQILLLTGSRREELLSLKWDDVDFKWKTIRLTQTKGGEERVIPMTPYVGKLLAGLPRRNSWVFSSSRGKTGRIQSPFKAFRECIQLANIDDLTLHGLRRSFKTLSEWVEIPQGIVHQIQGHKPSATVEKHYKKRPIDLLRLWHEKFEGWILEQAKIEQPTEVKAVELKVMSNGN